ncbi:hypothetical protein [Maribellus mangrovi]|uniref:hypothetical protein n=1 Tax=Maribellus mangrovi TaxID=3133146 RepID=UPI0030EB5441
MKTIKTIMMTALLFISATVAASGNLELKIVPGENNLNVNISNAVKSTYEIEVTDSNGDIVYYKITNKPSTSYNYSYSYSSLSDGEYTYKVRLEDETITALLKINKGEAKVIEQRKDVEPHFLLSDKQLNISFLNFEREKLLLLVYDNQNNEVLYRKGFNREFAIQHALNFSELNKGSYNAILSTQSENYKYEINID